MINSYATLQSSIASFLHRTDMTAIIQEFIADAETRIANDLRRAQRCGVDLHKLPITL